MSQTRTDLYPFFKKHAIPTESNFRDLIDSMLNQEDDGVFKPAGDPLSVKGIGIEEGLLNFYRADDQGVNQLTWQLKQKPASATNAGLSIHDAVASNAPSRLFIESGTGNVGLGTTVPKSALAVSGGVAVGTTYATTNAAGDNNLIVEGNVGIGTAAPKNKLDVEGGAVIGASYSGTKTAPTDGLLVQGNVGIGTPTPKNKLDVEGGAVIGASYSGTKTAPTDGLLVQGNVGIGKTNPEAKLHVAGL